MGDISDLYGGHSVPTDQPSSSDFDVLPAGWYAVEIESAEIKDNKAGTGKFLKLKLSVVGERFTNRKVFTNITLMNPNTTAVEIGMRELNDLGAACGLAALGDTAELVGKTLDVRVKIDKPREGYDADNSVNGYAKLGSKSSSQPATGGGRPPAHAGAAPAAVPTKAKLPWEK